VIPEEPVANQAQAATEEEKKGEAVAPQKKAKRAKSIDRNDSAEEMDSDDLEGDLNLSDEDTGP
jgi:hypothetical protein